MSANRDRDLLVTTSAKSIPEGTDVLAPTQLKQRLRHSPPWRTLRAYRDATWHVPELGAIDRPMHTQLALRCLARRSASIVDDSGARTSVTWKTAISHLRRAARDRLASRAVLRDVQDRLARLGSRASPADRPDQGRVVYIWSELAPGLRAGGMVTHTAGVLNALLALGQDPLVVTSRRLLNVDPALPQHVVDHGERYWDEPEVLCLALNQRQEAAVADLVRGEAIRFVYQRYARWNVVGADVADRLNVPLVLEYNGSELWVADHWGSPIARRGLAEQIELANLKAAAIVVVVSEPMRAELLGRGVDPGAILVVPNGVDTDVYRPDVDGSRVRRELDLEARTVIGFIGTFGAWHGTRHLADAALELLTVRPDLRDRIVFLMVGDGPHLAEVRRTIADAGEEASFRLTGLVPQDQGPEHLAAADILVAPHQPNPDGSPFFGSPTKLFEYMAMGRGIVASDLDQIGEVLTDGHSALLVPPEDPRALAHAVALLVDDPPLRARLGSQARRDAIERHTWRAHTTRILDAVEQLPER